VSSQNHDCFLVNLRLYAAFCFLLLAGCGSKPVEPRQDPCLRVRIGLDIGSGSSKARSAVVDVCRQRLVRELARDNQVIAFKDHLLTGPVGGKHFAPDFLIESGARIGTMVATVRERTQSCLRSDSKFALLASLPIEVAGVATEAFRQAANSGEFMDHLKATFKASLQTVDQIKEGHLGFISVMAALGLVDSVATTVGPAKIVSWDIGGGSLQIVAYEDQGKWLDFGSRTASIPMRDFVAGKFKKQSAFTPGQKIVTPNPIISPGGDEGWRRRQFKKLMSLVRRRVAEEMSGLRKAGWMSSRALKISGREVYGIGGVHNGILRFLRRLYGDSILNELTPELLDQALQQAVTADDVRLVSEYQVRAEYAPVIVTNMLLVKAVMDLLSLEKVRVLDIDNTYGVLVSPEFWSQDF
jgi:exopolyphosphatase/guanosine-5'-triphosphate,3'-diphosphate pyrophosphatase